jgi:uncharacterized protein YijF (DUF1287 family)
MRRISLKTKIFILLASGLALIAMASVSAYRKAFFVYKWTWTYEANAQEAEKAPENNPGHGEAENRSKSAKEEFVDKLTAAAVERTRHDVTYDPSYVVIPYPGGDVPDDRGVCTDVLIRAYRRVGVDLQKEVHEDMKKNFSKYPKIWGLKKPDSNIDHRRVPNLMVFFKRKGEALPVTQNPADYKPGDLVAWDLGGGITHIGMVVDRKSQSGGRYMVVHNIGSGPRMEDMLFDYKIIGHFRFSGNME